MNHDEIKEELSAFYDQELPVNTRQEISEHLSQCSECRAQVDAWEKTTSSLFQASPDIDSERFVRKVMNRIEENSPSADSSEAEWVIKWPGFRWFYPTLASAALAGFIFLMTYIPGEDKESADSAWILPTDNVKPDQILSDFVEGL